ncbi:MAG: hypothetical protein ACPIOQ_52075, partial [Promethearchaeia archaeon]
MGDPRAERDAEPRSDPVAECTDSLTTDTDSLAADADPPTVIAVERGPECGGSWAPPPPRICRAPTPGDG